MNLLSLPELAGALLLLASLWLRGAWHTLLAGWLLSKEEMALTSGKEACRGPQETEAVYAVAEHHGKFELLIKSIMMCY